MRKRALFAALIAILTAVPTVGLPMGSRPDDGRTYYFDGSQFREEGTAGQPAIATRTGYYPKLLAGGESKTAIPLPAGTGALAGICYLQQSGGKLRSATGSIPLAGITVTVRGGGIEKESHCDDRGFFVLALPPGRYDVRSGSDTRSVTVESDKTTLTPLRGGKRMVD